MFTQNSMEKIVLKTKQRVGRGNGSHRGKNSGKGDKGQTKRGHVRLGFEGGQKPLNRRLPKFKGFKARENKQREVITLSALNKAYSANETVSMATLLEKKLINENIKIVRIINTGVLDFKLNIDSESIHLTKGVKEIIK
jgi:large subunit ribosomal protein L15